MPGAPGDLALTTPATKHDPKSAQRPALMVRMLSCDDSDYYKVIIKISGVSGVAGVFPVVTPVEDTSPGPATVSKETVLLTTRAVLESLPRPWTVITLTKVVPRVFISFTDGTCRYSDHRIQPGGDLHPSHQGDFLPTCHPR